MADDRLLIPQDPEYFQAVGLAVIAFARLEWDVAWCCERLAPGYISTIDSNRKVAGTIASNFLELIENLPNKALGKKIKPHAELFKKLVGDRNGLLHGKPGTAPGGAQLLHRHGDWLPIDMVNSFSDRCVQASAPLNALLYDELKTGFVSQFQ
jgi:hypothetical protein